MRYFLLKMYKWPFRNDHLYFPNTNTGNTKYFLIQLSGLKPLHHQNMQNTQNGFYNHLRQNYNQQLVTNIKIYKQSISNLKKREIQNKFLL